MDKKQAVPSSIGATEALRRIDHCSRHYKTEWPVWDEATRIAALGAIARDALASPSATVTPVWIPVSERLPEDWKIVLLFCPDTRPGVNKIGQEVMQGYHYGADAESGYPAGWTKTGCFSNGCAEPTHWMPLPSAPTDGTANNKESK